MGVVELKQHNGCALDESGPLVGLTAVMERLGLSAGRIYYHVARGHLPAVRLGRRVMFDPRAVERFIATGGVGLSDRQRALPERSQRKRRGRPRSTAGE
jgi:excisionase family DNA binding protein